MKCDFYLLHVFSYPDCDMDMFQAHYLLPLTWEFWVESEADCHICRLKKILSLSLYAYIQNQHPIILWWWHTPYSLPNSLRVKIFNTSFEALWYNFQGHGIADIFLITVK